MKKLTKDNVLVIGILFCLGITVLFDVISVPFFGNEKQDFFLGKIFSLGFGGLGMTLLMRKEGSGLFQKPTNLLFLLPALIVAVDNFQFASFFAGKMGKIEAEIFDWVLFALYCLTTGFFEEGVFRGTLFPVLAGKFEKNKKGLWKTVLYSSLIFGGMHVLNIFSGANVGATLLQVGYSILTGGLFAFVLIKTKNILFCALTHGVYNFAGLLFSAEQGLGSGVVFDFPTALTMLIVCVGVGIFAIISFMKYSETERKELYSRLGFGVEVGDE